MLIIIKVIFIILILILLILYIGFNINLNLIKKEKEINGLIEIYFSKIRLVHKEIYPQKKEEKKEEKEENKNIKQYLPLIRENKETLKKFVNIILKSKDSINLKKLNIDLILGFESSVDTAKTIGIFWIFATPLNLKEQCHVYGEADFSNEIFDFKLDLNLKIRLIKPIARIIKLFLNKSTIKLITEFIKIEKEK